MLVEEKLNLNLPFNKKKLEVFLAESDLFFDSAESCYCVFDNDEIVACGCRDKNILKCFAVSDAYRNSGLFDKIISALLTECYTINEKTLFVFTKLENTKFFESYRFKTLSSANKSVLMYKSDMSILEVLEKTVAEHNINLTHFEHKKIGSIVINANPFTRGHKFLIETASRQVDFLFVFVVEENKSFFSFEERFHLVKENTKDIPNATVLPSTKFLISSATFPSYFLKEKKLISTEHALIDARIFAKYFVPQFKIAVRFLGDEPLDASTKIYNEVLAEELPKYHCAIKIIDRLSIDKKIVSASLVRKYFLEHDFEKLSPYVSEYTLKFLKEKAHAK